MIESLKKNGIGIAIMFIAANLACFGQLFWKLSVVKFELLIVGFILYGLGAMLMLFAYRFGSVSVLQPVLATNYVLSIIVGFLILGEDISIHKVAGIIVVTVGVRFIAGGDI